MNNWVLLAIFAWISMWAWGFFHDKSINFLNPIIWATFVSFIAFIIWIIIIIFSKDISFDLVKSSINYKGIFFIFLVWIFALAIDFFTLKTFSTWINISVALTIIIIISIISSVVFWVFFAKETINFYQILWILIILVWVYLLLRK